MQRKILIAERQPLVRLGLRSILEHTAGCRLVGEVDRADSAVRLCELVKPQIVLWDVNLPGPPQMDMAMGRLSEICPDTLVICLGECALADDVKLHNVTAGWATIRRNDTEEQVCEILSQALARCGGQGNQPDLGIPTLQGTAAVDAHRLSQRETEALRLLGRGLTNEEIGIALGSTARTARHHVSQILKKLGCKNRTEAVLRALEWGWIENIGL